MSRPSRFPNSDQLRWRVGHGHLAQSDHSPQLDGRIHLDSSATWRVHRERDSRTGRTVQHKSRCRCSWRPKIPRSVGCRTLAQSLAITSSADGSPMIQSPQSVEDQLHYRVAIVLPHSREILAEGDGDSRRLPTIAIPRWSRVAEQVTTAIKHRWNLQTIMVDSLAHSDDAPGLAVLEARSCDELDRGTSFAALSSGSNLYRSSRPQVAAGGHYRDW